MDEAKIRGTLLLEKGEEFVAFLPSRFETSKSVVETYLAEKSFAIFWKRQVQVSHNVEKPVTIKGALALTTNRLIFLQESGIFSKEIKAILSMGLQNITNVSIGGLIVKHLNISAEQGGYTQVFKFQAGNSETFKPKIIEQRNQIKEKETITAKKVIIEEKPGETPEDVLKRRLAKGEITTEEFHKKVQRM